MRKEEADTKAAMPANTMMTADMDPMMMISQPAATAAAHNMTTIEVTLIPVRAAEAKEISATGMRDIIMMIAVSVLNMMTRDQADMEPAEVSTTKMIDGPAIMMMIGQTATVADNHMMKTRIMEAAWRVKDGAIMKVRTRPAMMMAARDEWSTMRETREDPTGMKTVDSDHSGIPATTSIGAHREIRETVAAGIKGNGKMMTAAGTMIWVQAGVSAAISATGRMMTVEATGIEPCE